MTTTRPAELNNGVWTSWLPVATAWPSQPACNSAAWARFGIQPSESFWPYIYDPAYGQSVANTLTCLPPEATQWWDGAITASGVPTQWSMGPIVCPEAYSTLSTTVVSAGSTSVICCPTDFSFVRGLSANLGIDGVCTSTMVSGQQLVYADPAALGFMTATTTFTSAGLLMAAPFEGYIFAVSTTSSSQSTSSASQSGLPSNRTSTGSGTIANPGTRSSGLATGAKAGIGIGAVALISFAILAAILVFRRRKQYTGLLTANLPELPGGGGVRKGELWVSEQESQDILELNNRQKRSELAATSKPVELQG